MRGSLTLHLAGLLLAISVFAGCGTDSVSPKGERPTENSRHDNCDAPALEWMTIVEDGGTPDLALVAWILSTGARTDALAATLTNGIHNEGSKILDGLRKTHKEVRVSREFFEKATTYRHVLCNLERQIKTGILTGGSSHEAQQRLLHLSAYFLNVANSINPSAYNQVETLLNLPFFQLMEARYLEHAQTSLRDIDSSGNDDKLAKTRLDLLYNIIRLTLLEPDASNSRQVLLDRFTSFFPTDPWVGMLKAMWFFRQKAYSDAIGELDKLHDAADSSRHLHQETVSFFKGVCYLNLFKQDLSVGSITGAVAIKNAHKAKSLFEKVTELITSNEGHGTHYNDIALSSAFTFHGIVNYYQHDIQSAVKDYEKAANHSATGTLKARALNNVGYMYFVLGKWTEAETALINATIEDPNFPYAWSNLGYVRMATGDSQGAKKIFQKIRDNKEVQRESQRDVILAKLAIVHLMEQERNPVREVLKAYTKVLTDLNHPDFAMMSDSLRLAYVHHAIGKKVYLSDLYQGLEIIALCMFAKSFFEASAILDKNPQETHARRVLQQAQKDYESIKTMIDPTWFHDVNPSGFFGIIRKPLISSHSRVLLGTVQ